MAKQAIGIGTSANDGTGDPFGSIYDDSWWGNDDESNGWGIIYPV